MLKLVTGLPGAGKTSNELWDFLHNKDYASRPKYCTPIKGFKPGDHGVTEIEHIKEWRELPDGAVIICDEVQRFCGTDLGRDAPDWVQDFAIHRHSGKDFIFITQSPMYIHPFARKLVNPHVNYHRPWNMKGVKYTWENVQSDPTSTSAKKLGQSQLVKTDPKVFTLYTSTVLDTHKAKPPVKLIAVLSISVLITIFGLFYGFNYAMNLGKPPEVVPADPVATRATVQAASASPISFGIDNAESKPVWTEETIKPRLPGLPHTAPVFDNLTAPTDFPRVAACMSSESRGSCNCYTQQGTPIDVPASACLVYIKHGSFDYWLAGRKQQSQQPAVEQASPAVAQPVAQINRGSSLTVVADNSRIGKTSRGTP